MATEGPEPLGVVIERVVNREGLELVHWEKVGPAGNSILRIYIDKPDGIGHDDCERVSKQVGVLIDVEDLISGRYTLEVSSPGIERGLYKPADYERFAGSRIKLRAIEPIQGQRTFRGTLKGFSVDKVIMEADGVGLIEIPYEKVAKANIEFKF